MEKLGFPPLKRIMEEEGEREERGEKGGGVGEWVRECVKKTDKGGVYKVVDVFEVGEREGGGEERGWGRWQERMAERFLVLFLFVGARVNACDLSFFLTSFSKKGWISRLFEQQRRPFVFFLLFFFIFFIFFIFFLFFLSRGGKWFSR